MFKNINAKGILFRAALPILVLVYMVCLLPILPFLFFNRMDYKKKIKGNPLYKSVLVGLLEKHPLLYELSILYWNYPMFGRLYDILPPMKGNVLQVGCGTGLLNKRYRKRSDIRFINLDLNKKALAYGKRKKRFDTYMHANIYNTPLEDHSVDVIIFARCFHHIKNHKRAFLECERLLKPHGTIIIIDPIGLYDTSDHGFMTNTMLDGIVWCFNPNSFSSHLANSISNKLEIESIDFYRQPTVSNYHVHYPHTDVVAMIKKI